LSTVLDALRRLEKDGGPPEERPDQRKPDTSWLEAPCVDESLFAKAAGFLLSRSRIFWIGCAGFLLLAAVLAAAQMGMFSQPKTQDRLQVRNRIEPPQPAYSSPERVPASRNQNSDKRLRAVRPPAKPASASPPSGVKKAAPVTEPAPRVGSDPAPRPAVRTASRSPVSEPVQPPQKESVTEISKFEPDNPAAASLEKPGIAEKEGRGGEIAVLPAGSNLKLQAISWSDQPAKRIAVVNGSVLKEGDKIQGYLLQEIKNDEVIFRYQRQRWRLVFANQ
jgi:hypothetical protein